MAAPRDPRAARRRLGPALLAAGAALSAPVGLGQGRAGAAPAAAEPAADPVAGCAGADCRSADGAGDEAVGERGDETADEAVADAAPDPAERDPASGGALEAAEDLAALELAGADRAAFAELEGQRWSLRGALRTQGAVYLLDRGDPGNDQTWQSELRLELDLHLARRLSARLRPWLLIDALDPDVLRYEPLEVYLDYAAERWDARAGQFIESWGIVDTVSPLDVLSRTDLAVDALSPPRRGELGARLRVHGDSGDVIGQPSASVYVMPWFRELDFPSEHSRMRPAPPGGVLAPAEAERPDGADGVLLALRAEHTLATPWLNADLQYVVARGPAHVPTIGVAPQDDGSLHFVPEYFGTWTIGGGFRAVPNGRLSELTFKAEVAYVVPYELGPLSAELPERYLQLAAGFSRTFSFESDAELSVNVEVLGELGADDALARARLFQRDCAVRVAWSANDPARTEVEARAVVDWRDGTVLANLVARRQLLALHRDLGLELEAQLVRIGDDSATALPANPSALITRLGFAF